MTWRLVALIALVGGTSCRSRADGAAARANVDAAAEVHELEVPRTTGEIKCDGELNEKDWSRSLRTGGFAESGEVARPFSEARFLRDEHMLYVALYAADQDIRPASAAHDGPVWTGDSVSIRVLAPTHVTIDVSASGVITDAQSGPPADPSWESGAVAGVEMDGTASDDSDEDEEWVAEIGIPISSLCGGASCRSVALQVSRCDTPRSGKRTCTSWGGASTHLVLDAPGRP